MRIHTAHLKAMLLLLSGLALFIFYTPSFSFGQHKNDFLRGIRAEIENTHNQLSPLTASCFSLADTNMFLRGVDSYVRDVAVDTDYLAHFKMSDYLSSFLWAQHPESGLTQPRYQDAGWGDIAFTPQERRYSGWVIMAQPPDPQGDVTAFHEAVHAYHLHIKSNADQDRYGGPESVTNNFPNLLSSFVQLDNQLQRVVAAKQSGLPFQALEQRLMDMIDLRERKYMGFANPQFKEVLANIGGRADWQCYRDLVRQAIDQANPQQPQLLEIRATHPGFSYPKKMTLLKGQSVILKAYLVYPDGSEKEVTTEADWSPQEFFQGGRGTFSAVREIWFVPVTAQYEHLRDKAVIDVVEPRITVKANATPPGYCGSEGTDVTYSITVENPGLAWLSDVWLTHSQCSDLYVSGAKATMPFFLGHHSSETFQCSQKIDRRTTSDILVTAEYSIDRAGGTSVQGTVGDKVQVVVSDGSLSVPDVTGWNVATAVSEIRKVGLKIRRIRIARSEIVAPGNVISQTPTGGTDACMGDKIDLVRSWPAPDEEDDDDDSRGLGPTVFRAELDCGSAFELEPGDFVGKSCGVVVRGWADNDFPVEVEVDLPEGSSISVFPAEDRQYPMNMHNTGISDYWDRYVFSLSFRAKEDALPGLNDMLITVRQEGAGEIVLPLSILVLEEGQTAGYGEGIRPPAEVVTGSDGDFCVWRHKSFGDRPACFNFSRARCDNSRYQDPKYELVGTGMTWQEAGARLSRLGSYHDDAYGCHTDEEQNGEDEEDEPLNEDTDVETPEENIGDKAYFKVLVEGSGYSVTHGDGTYKISGWEERALVVNRPEHVSERLEGMRKFIEGDPCEKTWPRMRMGESGPNLFISGPKVTIIDGPYFNYNEFFDSLELAGNWQLNGKDGPSWKKLREMVCQ